MARTVMDAGCGLQGAMRQRGEQGRCPRSARRGSRWRQPAARAGLVWRLRTKPRPVAPDPTEIWLIQNGCINLMQFVLR